MARAVIDTTHPISVKVDAAWPVAVAETHRAMDVGEISLTTGITAPNRGGASRTRNPIAAIPAVAFTPVPTATVTAMKNAGTIRYRRVKRPTTARSGSAPYAKAATTTDTASGTTTPTAPNTRSAAANLPAMMLDGETGFVRLQASVPRSRSVEMRPIVASNATIAVDCPFQPRR